MSTKNQLVRKGGRKKKKKKEKSLALKFSWNSLKRKFVYSRKASHKYGVCKRVGKLKPRKPNSALRSVAKVALKNKKIVNVYIPGEKHNLQEYSLVMINGGGAKDLPGYKYSVVRGVADCSPVEGRKRGRSLYGTKRGAVEKRGKR